MTKIDINDDDWDVDLESNIVTHKTALYNGQLIRFVFIGIEGKEANSIKAPWSPKNPHDQQQDLFDSAGRAFQKLKT